MIADAALLAAWRAGDRSAGATLLRRHVSSVAAFFRTKVGGNVDDLVQATFLACVESPDHVPDGISVRAWLLGIARMTLLRHFRKQSRETRAMQREAAAPRSVLSPSGGAASRQEQRLLLRALQTLPLDLQIALELHYWEHLTNDEIAMILEIPQGTVKSRLHRARTELKSTIVAIADDSHVASTTVQGLEAWARSLAPAADDAKKSTREP